MKKFSTTTTNKSYQKNYGYNNQRLFKNPKKQNHYNFLEDTGNKIGNKIDQELWEKFLFKNVKNVSMDNWTFKLNMNLTCSKNEFQNMLNQFKKYFSNLIDKDESEKNDSLKGTPKQEILNCYKKPTYKDGTNFDFYEIGAFNNKKENIINVELKYHNSKSETYKDKDSKIRYVESFSIDIHLHEDDPNYKKVDNLEKEIPEIIKHAFEKLTLEQLNKLRKIDEDNYQKEGFRIPLLQSSQEDNVKIIPPKSMM